MPPCLALIHILILTLFYFIEAGVSVKPWLRRAHYADLVSLELVEIHLTLSLECCGHRYAVLLGPTNLAAFFLFPAIFGQHHKKSSTELGLSMAAVVCYPGTWETEAGELLGVQGQPRLQRLKATARQDHSVPKLSNVPSPSASPRPLPSAEAGSAAWATCRHKHCSGTQGQALECGQAQAGAIQAKGSERRAGVWTAAQDSSVSISHTLSPSVDMGDGGRTQLFDVAKGI